MKIELLTEALYIKFDGAPPPTTLKGVALTDGDEVLGVCCMSVMEGENFVICGLSPEANKRGIIEAWAHFSAMLDDKKIYYALIDDQEPSAETFLTHFGFEPFKDDIYIYRGV